MSKVQIVWFRDLVRWDTEYFTGNHRLESKFKLVDLSEILIPRKERIKPNEYDGITPIVAKIPFSNPNIELRKEPKTKMDMYAVYRNDLLVSNINFHQGAVAICRENKVFASTHYQPYIVNTDNIDLEFLVLVLRQNSYQQYIGAKKIRGIKTESNFNFIKTLQIPLPPLKIQKQIVAKIQSIKAQIKALQEEEKRLKDEIEAYIYIALGLEKKQEAKRQKVFIVRFKDLDRWDTRHNQSIAINLCCTELQADFTNAAARDTNDNKSVQYLENINALESRPLRGAEALEKGGSSAAATLKLEAEKRGTPLDCRKSGGFFGAKGSGEGINPFLQKNENITDSINAESNQDYSHADSVSPSLNTLILDLKALLDSIPTPPPHGWEVKTLGEICETNIGLVYTPANVSNDEKDIIVLRSNNIQNGKIVYDDLIRVKNIKISPNKIANKGDLLMCVRNGSANLIGKTAMIDRDGVSFGAFMAIIRSKYNKFLYHLLQCDYFRNYTTQSRTSGINQISQNDIKNFKIPLPPLSVQEKILAHIQKIESSIATTQNKAKALELELERYIESTL